MHGPARARSGQGEGRSWGVERRVREQYTEVPDAEQRDGPDDGEVGGVLAHSRTLMMPLCAR
ncbi:MAG: hypothetical protein ACRDTT_19150 [Pseudonocardiaceae bacterium]